MIRIFTVCLLLLATFVGDLTKASDEVPEPTPVPKGVVLSPAEMAGKFPADEASRQPGPIWDSRFQVFPLGGWDQIPLTVDWPDPLLSKSPVTFGVALPRGFAANAKSFRLVDSNNHEVSAEFQPMATWDRKDGSIRWLLVNAEIKQGESYSIVRASPSAHSVALAIEETAESIHIRNGSLEVILSKTEPTLLAGAFWNCEKTLSSDEKWIVRPEDGGKTEVSIEDGEGDRYFPSKAPGAFRLSVVESGSHRIAVRREGWYVNAAGDRFCQFITYAYFRAGMPGFRLDHSLVVGFDTQKKTIRDIRISLPLHLKGERQARFGIGESPDEVEVLSPSPEKAALVQSSASQWTLFSGDQSIRTGTRAPGWVSLSDSHQGAALGIEYFWQQFPMEMAIEGNSLVAHLWSSKDLGPLSFKPSFWLGKEYTGRKVLYSKWYRDGLDEMTQAYGAAKTHALHFLFFEPPQQAEACRLVCALATKPVLVSAHPEWTCASGAIGPVHPRDPEKFPRYEAVLDALVTRQYWLRDRLANYGWITFGDVNYRLQNRTDPEKIAATPWRHFASMFYGFPNVMPLYFLRSGKREAWDFHRANTRHIMDIDICHLDSGDLKKVRGKRYGGIGGIFHYAGDQNELDCDSHLDFILKDLYMNGNLRAREVADYYVQAHLPLRGRSAYREYYGRHTSGSLRLFSEAYQATWNPEYLSAARQFADVLYRHRQKNPKLHFIHDYSDVYTNPAKLLFYELTGDKRMRDLFLNDMKALDVERDANLFNSRATTMAGPSQAFLLTGDPSFLGFAAWQADEFVKRIKISGEPAEIGAATKEFETADAGTLGAQLPILMAALAAADSPVEPTGPAHRLISSNGRVLLDAEPGQPVHIVGRSALPAWKEPWAEWIRSLHPQEQPVVVLTSPDGSEQILQKVVGDGEEFTFDIPASSQAGGRYILELRSPFVPASLILDGVRTSGVRPSLLADGVSQIALEKFGIMVPKGTSDFSLSIKPNSFPISSEINRDQIVRVSNAAGEQIQESRLIGGQNKWTEIRLNAGSPHEDEMWMVQVSPIVRAANEGFLMRFKGIPGFVLPSVGTPASTLEGLQANLSQPASTNPSLPSNSSEPWGGKGFQLQHGSVVKINGVNNLKLSKDAGYLGFWIWIPAGEPRFAARVLFKWGMLRLTDLGAYGVNLSVSQEELSMYRLLTSRSSFVFPKNRWTFMEIVWNGYSKDGWDISLKADGIEVGNTKVAAGIDWQAGEFVFSSLPESPSLGGFTSSFTSYTGGDDKENNPPEESQKRHQWMFDLGPESHARAAELGLIINYERR